MTEARCLEHQKKPPEVTREVAGRLVTSRPCRVCEGVRSRPENVHGPIAVPASEIARESAEAAERKASIAQGLIPRSRVRLSRTVGSGYYIPRGRVE